MGRHRHVHPRPGGVQPCTQVKHAGKCLHRHVDPRPRAYSHMHRSNTRKWAGRGTWNHVQGATPTSTGGTRGKGPTQARGSTFRGLKLRAQVQHAEKGRYRRVDQHPGAYSHVHMSNTRERARTGAWTHIQVFTAACTCRTRGKGPAQARGSTSRGLQPRAHVEQPEKGRHRYVDPRPGAYSHVNRSNSPKRSGTGTLIHVQGPIATCTCRKRGKLLAQARGCTSICLQPRTHVEHSKKKPEQARKSTSRGLQPRAQVEHAENGR